MKNFLIEERRRHKRFLSSGIVNARIFAAPGPSDATVPVTVQDISSGGLRIASSTAFPASTSVQCELRLPDIPASIPTMTQVRWVKSLSVNLVEMGLQFMR